MLPLTDTQNLGYHIPTRAHSPINVYTYPLVKAEPPFPFLVLPYSLLTQPGTKAPEDGEYHVRSATNMSYTRTLELLKRLVKPLHTLACNQYSFRHLGPHFDLEKLWDQHTYFVRISQPCNPFETDHMPSVITGVCRTRFQKFVVVKVYLFRIF